MSSSLTEVVTEEQVMPADKESELQGEQIVIPLTFPVISMSDYETDEEFGEIYKYANSGELTGNARRDKPILIMANRYVNHNDAILYRVDLPRDKKLAMFKPVVRRPCVTRRFRHEMVKYAHEQNGHYAAQGLFHTLATRFYWKSLFSDVTEFCKTCEVCQRMKVNFGHRYAPLNPVAVPDSMDHKMLTRTTTEGTSAVLVIVECFSGFPHLIPVPDMTALTTSRAIVRHIIPWWGQILFPGFVSSLFCHIKDLLGIKQVTSGSRTTRSNSLAEATVK